MALVKFTVTKKTPRRFLPDKWAAVRLIFAPGRPDFTEKGDRAVAKLRCTTAVDLPPRGGKKKAHRIDVQTPSTDASVFGEGVPVSSHELHGAVFWDPTGGGKTCGSEIFVEDIDVTLCERELIVQQGSRETRAR